MAKYRIAEYYVLEEKDKIKFKVEVNFNSLVFDWSLVCICDDLETAKIALENVKKNDNPKVIHEEEF